MMIKLLVDGGDMKPGPAIGQQLGPTGINIGQVIQKVNQATLDFKGVKVPVILDVNTKTKSFDIKVSSPPTSALIKKELGIEKGSGTPKTFKSGNMSIEQIISIAKVKYPNMIASEFSSAVKSVLGTCLSAGILVESRDPREISRDIEKGAYDSEISSQKTDTSSEKRKALDGYFASLKAKQELELKKEAEKKAEEEAKKAVAASAKPSVAGAPGTVAQAAEVAPASGKAAAEPKKASPADAKKAAKK
ncbi:50S ribosomal protein L11 [Candidatus Pacearchaeota archaeon]|nr:50S ribosomal protein L11 [Candidatus Pacearchaeota archaeon]